MKQRTVLLWIAVFIGVLILAGIHFSGNREGATDDCHDLKKCDYGTTYAGYGAEIVVTEAKATDNIELKEFCKKINGGNDKIAGESNVKVDEDLLLFSCLNPWLPNEVLETTTENLRLVDEDLVELSLSPSPASAPSPAKAISTISGATNQCKLQKGTNEFINGKANYTVRKDSNGKYILTCTPQPLAPSPPPVAPSPPPVAPSPPPVAPPPRVEITSTANRQQEPWERLFQGWSRGLR